MTDGVSLADIAAVTDNNKDGMFGGAGGGGMWIFALLILLLIGGGSFFGGNRAVNGEPVTEAGLCNAMNFNNLENAVGRLSDQNVQQTMQLGNGICNLGYELQGNIGQLGKEVALGQANLQLQASNNAATISQQLATCCCETQRAIDGVNYNAAQNTASINANTTAAVQKVLDAIQQDKIEALQGQVNQLQLQSALCGVVRYPNSTTFTAGYNPYFNANACGCGTTF